MKVTLNYHYKDLKKRGWNEKEKCTREKTNFSLQRGCMIFFISFSKATENVFHRLLLVYYYCLCVFIYKYERNMDLALLMTFLAETFQKKKNVFEDFCNMKLLIKVLWTWEASCELLNKHRYLWFRLQKKNKNAKLPVFSLSSVSVAEHQ